MRRRRLASLVVAAAALAGCGASPDLGGTGDGAAPAPAAEAPAAATPTNHEQQTAETALCTVLPTRIVGDLIGTDDAIDVSGDGSQCTWRGAGSTPGGEPSSDAPHLVTAPGSTTLQGAILDVTSYHAGRPTPGDPSVHSVTDVGGVGDEAYVVRLAGAAPTTLYVRDGDRALSLWLDAHPGGPADAERSLTRVAALLLDLA